MQQDMHGEMKSDCAESNTGTNISSVEQEEYTPTSDYIPDSNKVYK